MRRRRLRKLIKRLRQLQGQALTRDESLAQARRGGERGGQGLRIADDQNAAKDEPVTPQTFRSAGSAARSQDLLLRSRGGAVLQYKLNDGIHPVACSFGPYGAIAPESPSADLSGAERARL